MSDEHNPLLELQKTMKELSPTWDGFYQLLNIWKEHLRDWAESPAFSPRRNNLCLRIESEGARIVRDPHSVSQHAPPGWADELDTLVGRGQAALPNCTKFLNSNTHLKQQWTDYINKADTELKRIRQYLDRQNLREYVPGMVQHCKQNS